MHSEELIDQLALSSLEGMGPALFVRLLHHFGSARSVFKASLADWERVEGVRPPVITALQSIKDFKPFEKEAALLQKHSISVVSFEDPDYPRPLREIAAFPPLLFVWGRIQCLHEGDWLGVVGSRDLTEYGKQTCRELVGDLVAGGLRIVSGFARGVDITAHLAAVEAGGVTVGVLGGGFGHLYPSAHRKHVAAILEKGALISEFSYSVPPLPSFFPRRNRIVSGLSRGVLVVEADEKSGAMITARYALDQNRDLFAVPGPVHSDKSRGCHRLIQQGAKLVMEAKDVLNDWQLTLPLKIKIPFAHPEEHSIYEFCSTSCRTPDEIIEKTGIGASTVTMFLTKLELDGRIECLPGRRYQSV